MTLQMGIVKIEIKIPELVKAVEVFKENPKRAFEEISNEIKQSISETFNKLLQTEFDLFIGSAEQSTNKRNGFDERAFAIKGVGCIKLRIPIDRQRNFKSSIIPKNAQIDLRLKEDLAVLHLAGISNRTLALISKRILGVEVSAQTVHNSLSILESKALKWLDRDIKKNYWALFIDGTNFRTQRM
jgi:putative transposase